MCIYLYIHMCIPDKLVFMLPILFGLVILNITLLVEDVISSQIIVEFDPSVKDTLYINVCKQFIILHVWFNVQVVIYLLDVGSCLYRQVCICLQVHVNHKHVQYMIKGHCIM